MLANVYQMMRGLSEPWQRRHTNRQERQSYDDTARFLELNLGRGYYSYELFMTAPEGSDACRGGRSDGYYAGGGYVSANGIYDFFQYGQRRHAIRSIF